MDVGAHGAETTARSERIQRLLVLAYILAVSMPPIGLAMGIVLAFGSKQTSRHTIWIVALSLVASALWVLILTSGALSTASSDY